MKKELKVNGGNGTWEGHIYISVYPDTIKSVKDIQIISRVFDNWHQTWVELSREPVKHEVNLKNQIELAEKTLQKELHRLANRTAEYVSTKLTELGYK